MYYWRSNRIEYNDGLRPGGRRPRLYLVNAKNEVRKFDGQNIPEFCAIITSQYQKNGKWSNTDYTIALAPGVRPLFFLSPLHGTWGDDLSSWGEVSEHLALPVDVAKMIVRAEYRRTAERLDQLEAFVVAAADQQTTMKYILNSAVITSPGDYRYRLITADEARQWAEGGFVSAIGYDQTAEALTHLLGVPVPVDRRTITMQPGDEALVFRLVFPPDTPRIDPADKGRLSAAIMAGHFEIGLLVRLS